MRILGQLSGSLAIHANGRGRQPACSLHKLAIDARLLRRIMQRGMARRRA